MKTDPAIEAYAKALFEVANAEDAVTEVQTDLEVVTKTIGGHLKLKEVLGDASFPVAKKRDIVRQVFAESVSPVTLNMLTMIVDTGRDGQLAEIAAEFGEVAEAGTGAVTAEITTAVALSDELRSELTVKLADVAGKDVAIQEKIDPSVLGGVVVRMGGKVLDGSVRMRLAEMKSKLVEPAAATKSKGPEPKGKASKKRKHREGEA